MDLMNRRPGQPQQTVNSPDDSPSEPSSRKVKNSRFSRARSGGLLSIIYVTLLFSITVLLVGIVMSIFFFDNKREVKLVDSTKYQSVFLNNGQVYFGKISELTKEYLGLSDIYYLKVSQQVQPGKQPTQNDISLVKLGCELHGPQDNMVVNRDQITFWENLKDDGQVTKAINEYIKANPNGPNCQQQQGTNSSDNNNSSNTENSSNPSDNNSTNNSGNNTTNP